jgi:hypothetical protein
MPRGHWKAAFLESLRDTCNVRAACEAAGISPQTVYRARMRSPEFARGWDEAIEEGIQLLEFEARRRALHGTMRPVFHEGKVCGHVQEYSDTLMLALLKAHRPKVYRERHEIEAKHLVPPEVLEEVRFILHGDGRDKTPEVEP